MNGAHTYGVSGAMVRWADLVSDIARIDVLTAAIQGPSQQTPPLVVDAIERLAAILAVESVFGTGQGRELPKLIGTYLQELPIRPERACQAILAAANRRSTGTSSIASEMPIDGRAYAMTWPNSLDRLVLAHAHLCAAHAAARQTADADRAREIVGHSELARHLAISSRDTCCHAVSEYLDRDDLIAITQKADTDYTMMIGRIVAARKTTIMAISNHGHEEK